MKPDLEKFTQNAVASGCGVQRSLYAKRTIVATEEGIAIATENHYIDFSLDELANLREEINAAVISAVERFKELTMKEKISMADKLGMSYGKLQAVISLLEGGGQDEQDK